jgi:hypothetical protein
LAQELRKTGDFCVNPIKAAQDKIGRVYVQQAKFAAGRVWFPKGAAFLPTLKAELLSFPFGRSDDQVDSISQALAYDGTSFVRPIAGCDGCRKLRALRPIALRAFSFHHTDRRTGLSLR